MSATAQSVRSDQRNTKRSRCVICGGADGDPRGKARRCHGFMSDGYAHCSREEHAGDIELVERSQTYAHRLTGACNCGTTHGTNERDWDDIEAAYDYRDESGRLLSQVVRKVGKQFRQRRPDGVGGWDWKLEGTRRVLYRLPELLRAPMDALVFIVEGEKDVDRLRSLGVVATSNPQGANKWHFVDECARKALLGRHVVVVADDDSPGRQHATTVAQWALGVASSVRRIALYPEGETKRDVSDWLDEDHTSTELLVLVANADATDTGIQVEPPEPWTLDLEKALADVTAALGNRTTTERKPLFGVDAAHLSSMIFPPTPWRVKGLITKRGTAVAAGEPKGGIKTWLLLEGAIAIATGTKMCGRFPTDEGTVAIFFAEDQLPSVRNRVRSLVDGASRSLVEGRLHLQPSSEFIDILKDEDLAWLVASARRLGTVDVLMLDPLRDIHSGEEDKSDSMRDVMRRLRLLGDLLGCAVWVSHHTPKVTKDTAKRRPGQNLRGSSAIHGSIDCGLYIEPLEGDGTNTFGARVTSQVKSGRSAGVFDLKLSIVDDEQGEAITASWGYEQTEFKKGPAKHQADDDAMFSFVRELAIGGQVLSRTALKMHDSRPLPEKRTSSALDRLIDAKRLALAGGRVVVPGSQECIAND